MNENEMVLISVLQTCLPDDSIRLTCKEGKNERTNEQLQLLDLSLMMSLRTIEFLRVCD